MIEALAAQFRFSGSMLSGQPFHLPSLDRLLDTLVETVEEFGSVGADGKGMFTGPVLDADARRDLQRRRLRMLARRAATETAYYGPIFAESGLEPGSLRLEDLAALPLTPKEALKERPGAFVRTNGRPAFLTTSTGTTGLPTQVLFSAREIQQTVYFNAIGYLLHGVIGPEDVVQVNTSSRATLGNQCFSRACERIGAVWYQAGLVEPATSLALLTQRRDVPGKKPRTSFLNVYSSYLGELVTHGLAAGLGPEDFGLATISVGSEVVTAGLKRRAQAVFGPVRYDEGYAMTETWPFAGTVCEQGHLHFDPTHGLLEVLDPDTGQPAAPGAIGSLVATPFPPYRDASVVLRYDTEDLVRALAELPSCRLRNMPATSDLLGKRRLAVRTDHGWTTPRDVLEAVEDVDAVPLPGRVGFRAHESGVAVSVVAPGATADSRRRIGEGLEARGVPLTALELVEDRGQLADPLPLRGDLRELQFGDRR